MEERIGDRILKLMKECGYNQKELAAVVGTTKAAMSHYVSNKREPRIKVIQNLADALGTTTDYLIGGQKADFSYDKIHHILVRGAGDMTSEEKMKLMQVLLDKPKSKKEKNNA